MTAFHFSRPYLYGASRRNLPGYWGITLSSGTIHCAQRKRAYAGGWDSGGNSSNSHCCTAWTKDSTHRRHHHSSPFAPRPHSPRFAPLADFVTCESAATARYPSKFGGLARSLFSRLSRKEAHLNILSGSAHSACLQVVRGIFLRSAGLRCSTNM